jgi:histidinol phosphatase-like enzyme
MFSEIYKAPLKSTERTLSLDRDHTIIRDEGYFHDANSVKFFDLKFDFTKLLYSSNIAV